MYSKGTSVLEQHIQGEKNMFLTLTHTRSKSTVYIKASAITSLRPMPDGTTLVLTDSKGQYVNESAESIGNGIKKMTNPYLGEYQ